jgi:hypothetical protein
MPFKLFMTDGFKTAGARVTGTFRLFGGACKRFFDWGTWLFSDDSFLFGVTETRTARLIGQDNP